MSAQMLYRASTAEALAVDDESRTAHFVAATENGVDTWRGPEVLRMSGVDLARFRSNPVVLDTHDRASADCVVGRASVEVVGRELLATVTFAQTARAESVWQLVRGGFLRALSVGYCVDPDKVDRIREGETDEDVHGPAHIVRGWELYEISLVPIPADAAALKREFYSKHTTNEESRMAEETPAAPTAEDPKAPEPAATVTVTDGALRSVDELLPEELAARTEAAQLEREKVNHARIRAIAPPSLSALAEELIVRGVTAEEARKELLEALRAQSKPGFTPEPVPAPQTKRGEDTPTNPNSVDDLVNAYVKE